MLPMLGDYFERLQSLHTDINQTIADLPPSALDWAPGTDMNSLCVLVVHVAGAERYWIGDVVGQGISGRDRDAEFQTGGLAASVLVERLDKVLAHSRSVLEELTVPDLDAQRTSPRDGHKFTVAWALAHALEHTALHLGHIQITRQLWDQRRRREKA